MVTAFVEFNSFSNFGFELFIGHICTGTWAVVVGYLARLESLRGIHLLKGLSIGPLWVNQMVRYDHLPSQSSDVLAVDCSTLADSES